MWTFSHTNRPGRAQPHSLTRQEFASAVVQAYEQTGKAVEQWAVFQEVHPLSRSTRENSQHYHMVVLTQERCRWSEVAEHLRRERQLFASASTSSSRSSYWSAFAYCYAPSGKKRRRIWTPRLCSAEGTSRLPSSCRTAEKVFGGCGQRRSSTHACSTP